VESDHWGRWQGGGHMQADTLEELYAMAVRLGLSRAWLQSKPGRPWRDHYDLTADKREQAIALGAIPITARQAARRNSAARRAYLDTMAERLGTARLELWPLSPAAAAALPDGRDEAARLIGARLPPAWPGRAVLGRAIPMQAKARQDEARFGIWVIVRRDIGVVVGDIGFFGPPRQGAVEVGYSIVPEHRRQGYMTEAGTALVHWARSQAEVDTVLARCDEDNQASIRTLERLGFTRTGQTGGQIQWRFPGMP